MELDELEVRDARARKPREHHAVAGGNRRIGGFTKHLARAAGGQQHRSRMDLVRHVVGDEPGADAAAALDDQPDRAGVLLDPHARLFRHPLPQRAADLAAGGVGQMQHAPAAMRAFTPERQRARVVSIEPRAPLNQFMHVAHAVFNQHANGLRVAESITRGHGVGGVLPGRVAGANRCGNAALRIVGVALGGIGFGQDEHVARAGKIGGGAKARNAAADDQEVRAPRHRMLS